ncbi:hypothetical protein ABZ636_17960 [Streptomyces sp. NPDC007251]|uniref:hypothetical protein n=1 Tax=Streptomyces sp. NPDC007251 TaxID=3154483 RepID=UPI0033C7E841
MGGQYRHINDTVAQPPIERLLSVLAERGELQPEVPVATVARLLLAGLCEGNQIIADAADREDALTRTFHAIPLLMSGGPGGRRRQRPVDLNRAWWTASAHGDPPRPPWPVASVPPRPRCRGPGRWPGPG